ncbi:MAG: DUF4347 domain-containing protein [Deltaproteobacteria bacterium]|nr:DUF4347 domain-containing protein [Deltaproteobacteria bacterium]
MEVKIRIKRMIAFMPGLLFIWLFCLNSGAFGYVPSGDACPASEMAFIDPSVQDAETIVAQLPEKAEVVRLSPGVDGITQISAHLSKKRNLSAIRIISHGNAGYFVLNGKRIDGDFLRDYGSRISAWGRAMAENGDILLYACSLASGETGKTFVAHLADLTDADVAASTNVTSGLPATDHGSLTTSSDWDLEYQIGEIEAVSLTIGGYEYHLETRTVSSNGDDVGTVGTLRYWIANADAGDEITFDADYTITLGSQLTISQNLTITGRGAGNTIIQANANPETATYRVFNITSGTVTIENMTIRYGKEGSGGGIYVAPDSTVSALNLENVVLSGNYAVSAGAGLAVWDEDTAITMTDCSVENNVNGCGIFVRNASMTLDNSSVSDNDAGGAVSGGIKLEGTASLTVNCSTISGNTVSGLGGGIALADTSGLTLSSSTVSGNSATGVGGGIAVLGTTATLTMTNATISGNLSDTQGGGVFTEGTTTINSSTISTNHSDNNDGGAERGGGIYSGNGALTVRNSILADNYNGSGTGTGDDYYYVGGTLSDSGYNVVGYSNVAANATGGFDATTDILYNTKNGQAGTSFSSWTTGTGGGTAVSGSLGLSSTLADNGGPTQTLALSSGSFADGAIPYSAGSNTFNNCPALDQRSYYRAFTGSRDIGAYELDGAAPANGDYISTTTGNWSAVGTWDTYNATTGIWGDPSAKPTSSNNVVVAANHTVTVDGTDTVNAQTVSQGGILAVGANTLTASGAADIDGTLSISTGTTTVTGASDIDGTLSITDTGTYDANGTFDASNGAVTFTGAGNLKLASTVSSLGTLTAGSSTVTYDGSSGQTIPETNTFYNLNVNNSGGVTVNADATVNNGLGLTNGLVTLGDNDLTLGASATIIGTPSATNMIVTNGTGVLKKMFSGTGSFTFPVGDNTGTAEYSPATLNFASGTFAGGAYAAVNTTNTKQPNNTSTTDYLNRYWSVTQSGISSFSCDTTFNYLAADVAGTEADIYGGQYKDSAWTVLNAVDAANNKFQATVTGFSDFTGVEVSTPTTQASSIGFSSVVQTQMAVSWTRGNGDKVLVVAHQGSAVDSNPVNGTTYTANAAFGSGTQIGTGNYVVYKGTGTSVIVTGLTANTAYHLRAYEFNDGGVEERYITGTATSNPNNQTTLPNAPGAPTATAATSITGTGFSANWDAVSGATGYRLDVATDNDFVGFVTGYSNKDVGNVTTSSVTGLTGSTTYYYRIRAENTGGTGWDSNTITATTLSVPTKVDLTGPTNVNAGAVSTVFTLTSQDGSGNMANVTSDTVFNLTSSTAGTATFYSDAAGTSVITQTTITNGTSAATFYYKDTNAGTPTLTAAWNSGGTDLGSDTLQVTVSLASTTLATSTSVSSAFRDFKVTVTKIRMGNSGASWVTIFSGTAELDLVNGGTFPGISNISLPAGTYNQIEVTFRNSLPVTGTLTYSGTAYYTTAATFGGASNVASDPSNDPGSQTVFTFRISDWGALDADVTQTFDITPITVDTSTDYQPTLRFTISQTFLLKGTADTVSTYYFELSPPTVSIVEP